MAKFFKNYALSIVLIALFLVSWGGQAWFQYQHELAQAEEHGTELTTEDFSNSFLASTFENWQSEFLQLFSFVILSAFLIHKSSPQSKDGDEKMQADIKEIKAMLEKKSRK